MVKKSNKAKWIILGLLIVALVLFALNFNNIIPSSKQNVTKAYIEPEVYALFNNSEEGWLYLRVYVSQPIYRDIVINSTSYHWYNQTTVSNIGFSTFVKKNDFDNLTKNPYVKRIYIDLHQPLGIDQKSSLVDEKLYVEPEIYQRWKDGAYVTVIVVALSTEATAEIVKTVSQSKEILISEYNPKSNHFLGAVSKKGVEILSKTKGVVEIRTIGGQRLV